MQSFLSGKRSFGSAYGNERRWSIKAQSGMFADISGAIGSADAPTFSMPPAFASLYNYIKTNFPNLSDADEKQAQELVNEEE